MSERYPWILKRPARERPLPLVRPSRLPTLVCGRCGCEARGRRKKCPACHARYVDEGRTDVA